MNLDQAIELIKTAVKHTGTIDQKHIDLTIVPVEKRELYEKALAVAQLAIKDGKIGKEDLYSRIRLDF